jgi:D-glycero-D-manno-heptose 1,7-bisphosphate phosphatase
VDARSVSGRALLVDRDGTINEERNSIHEPGELALISGSATALARARDDLGLKIVVVTNQAEIGRGNLTHDALERIHDRLRAMLATDGASIDAIETCPHRPEEGCACRKPGVAMIVRAAERLGFEPAASFVVGDHEKDIAMGRAVGATTILVRTGHGAEQEPLAGPLADHVADDLAGAVAIIATLIPQER